MNNDIKKAESKIVKLKTKLYKIFVSFSVLICVFLLPFVNKMTSKFPSAYPGDESSSGVITSEIANQIAIYVWPILIAYIIMLIILIKTKTNKRKVYYPLSLVTITVIMLNIGIIYWGYLTLIYLIFLFAPIVVGSIKLSQMGAKKDNEDIQIQSLNNVNSCVQNNATYNELTNLNNNKIVSKRSRVIMIVSLIGAVIIFFDNLILSTNWYFDLQWQALINHDEQLKLSLQALKELILGVNWLIVLLITVLSAIFMITDRKKQNNTQIYWWYIVSGGLYIFLGATALTPMLYAIASLVNSIKNKKNINNSNTKFDNSIIVISSIFIVIVVVSFCILSNFIYNY